MEKWVAVPVLGPWGEQLPAWMLALLMAGTVLIAAGGYVINDYFDIKIDRINRPERLIVSAAVTKTQAMWCFRILTGLGIVSGLVLAWYVRSTTLALVFVLVPGLLWFYSASYKRQFLVGNLIVSLAAGMTPLIVAIANVAVLQLRFPDLMQYTSLVHDLYMWLGGFALFAFLTTFVREIIKDLQDVPGDRELECHSMPVVIGTLGTKIVVTVMTAVIVALVLWLNFAVVPFPHGFTELSTRFALYGLAVPMLCALWLVWSAKIESDYRMPQLVWKFVMFIGTMYSFVILRCLPTEGLL
jgi:4-hydroxybenzoate polyprenyltransferase